MLKTPKYYRGLVHKVSADITIALRQLRVEDRVMWHTLLADVAEQVKVSLMAEEAIIDIKKPKQDD